jgi:hypothetical protein
LEQSGVAIAQPRSVPAPHRSRVYPRSANYNAQVGYSRLGCRRGMA